MRSWHETSTENLYNKQQQHLVWPHTRPCDISTRPALLVYLTIITYAGQSLSILREEWGSAHNKNV